MSADHPGKGLAIAVLCGLFAIPFGLEYLQIDPRDLQSGLGDADALGVALMPAGISLVGWLRLTLWAWLLSFAYRGRRWARITVAVLASIRGVFALYHVLISGFRSDLAIFFLMVGLAYLFAALLLFRASELLPYLTRQRARSAVTS